PIYQAAEDAGEAEEQAKREGRNRFAFLGRTWTWKAFHQNLRPRKEELKALVTSEANKAVLDVIQNLAQMADSVRKAGLTGKPAGMVWDRWMWLAAYQLTRVEERTQDKQWKRYLSNLRGRLTRFESLQEWAYAARWAELEIRQ
ncbi:hypothetical protein D6833_03220, partial [Candidatus Parcubacteria bacterium]